MINFQKEIHLGGKSSKINVSQLFKIHPVKPTLQINRVFHYEQRLLTKFDDVMFWFQIIWRHDSIVNFRQHLRVRRPKLRAVLALSKQGHLYDTVKWACDRLNVESSHAPSTDTAIAACKEGAIPSLLVLDCRNYRNIDAEAVAK